MTNPSMSSPGLMPAIIPEHRGWFTFLGIVLIIAGAAAIAFPFITTIAAKIFLGGLFLVGGVTQVIHAFSTQKWSEFLFDLLIGALYVLVGAWLAFLPLTAIITLTILLAALFVVEGVLEISMGFRTRPKEGWVWLVFSGTVAIAAGVLILSGLPGTATWAIGLLVGINMIFSGVSYVSLASTVKA
jgi:uncharacterized membrane protein HdeD (DUF308 family)